MLTRKNILILILLFAIIGGAVAYTMFNKEHADLAELKTDFKLNAVVLFAEFETDENAANAKYIDKVIEISGNVQEVSHSQSGSTVLLTVEGNDLGGVISCGFVEKTTIKGGDNVTLKGTCSGGNMPFDVQLSRCIEINSL